MAWCLPRHLADTFLGRLKSGEITPEKMLDMTSEERHKYFVDLVGEDNAGKVNALLESKILLKDQQRGMVTWAKQISGMKPDVKKDILSKVMRMDKVLNPTEETEFLHDLASQKLGVSVSAKEAGHILELANKVESTKAKIDSGGNRLDYGAAFVEFKNHINNLKAEASKETILQQIKQPVSMVSKLAGLAKAVKASMDNSWQFRQGIKTLYTHPVLWSRNFAKSFIYIKDVLAHNKDVMSAVEVDIYSRPNAVNGNYSKWGIDIGIAAEEAYPTQLPEKIPLLGRLYKASEVAFTATARRTRADLADYYHDIAQKSGADIANTKESAESFGKFINSLTARGHLGRIEPVAGVVNNVFFSPRNLKANIDFLTAHQLQKDVSPYVRKQAAINLLKAVSGTAAILAVAKIIDKDSVDFDPRSANFGKIKAGDTRFDVSGGMASIITLASRLITFSTKSSTTGKITSLTSGKFGAPTGTDVIYNFFENKLSPAASIVKDILKGGDFQGNKPTVLGELNNLLMPLTITTYLELKNNPNSANILLSMIADQLGISVNTYSAKKINVKNLSVYEVADVIKVATPQERKELIKVFNKKYDNKYKIASAEERTRLKKLKQEMIRK